MSQAIIKGRIPAFEKANQQIENPNNAEPLEKITRNALYFDFKRENKKEEPLKPTHISVTPVMIEGPIQFIINSCVQQSDGFITQVHRSIVKMEPTDAGN